MKKLVFFSIVMLLATFSLYADFTGTITVNSQSLNFEQKDGYDIIKIGDYGFLSQPGAPLLPSRTFQYIIPLGKKVTGIQVISCTEQIISGTFNIYPCQNAYVTGDTFSFTQPDPAIYNSNTFWPSSNIFEGDNQVMSGCKLYSFQFSPLKYNPVTGQIKLVTSITFSLTFADDDNVGIALPQIVTEKAFKNLKNKLTLMISNPNDISSCYQPTILTQSNSSKSIPSQLTPGYTGTFVEYVIITNEALKNCFQDIINWKIKKGTPAATITTEWISQNYSGCDLPEQIRNFIKDAYVNWGTNWVLLGGDISIVPPRYVYYKKLFNVLPTEGIYMLTNLYFSCLDGNWNLDGDFSFGEGITDKNNNGSSIVTTNDIDMADLIPDIYIGRLPVENADEISRWKIKFFEYVNPGVGANNHGSINNKKDILLFSLDQPGVVTPNHMFNVRDELINTGIIPDYLFQNGSTYDPLLIDASSSQIYDAFNGNYNNKKYHIMCGHGHGNPQMFDIADSYMCMYSGGLDPSAKLTTPWLT